MTQTTDRIEKQIDIQAPLARVWKALSDSTEFGTWFGVRLTGEFAEGASLRGEITTSGCEQMECELHIVSMQPERMFSYRWAPCPGPETEDVTTLVEFKLQPENGGTRLTVTESGFDQLPEDKRTEAFLRNEGGWAQQVLRIESHVTK